MELLQVEKMRVKRITDTTTKREEKEAQTRTISFESEDVTVTLKGNPSSLYDFSVGDIVEVRISRE